MSKNKVTLLAALLCVGTAMPALADYENIGKIEVGDRYDMRNNRDNRADRNQRGREMDHDVKRFNLGGSVDSLQLRAERANITCRSVEATFGNGRTRNIFHGDLREGRTTRVDLPGNERSIRRLDFNCMAQGRNNGATIRIAADIGGHRDEWRRSPDWERSWSRIFNWGSNAFNDWKMIGSERFEGRGDRETSFAGVRGRRVDSVALRPLETDARCSRVTASFANNRSQPLNVNGGDLLRRGQYYKLDLPGNNRNLERISMRCSAVGGRNVTIQVFTSK